MTDTPLTCQHCPNIEPPEYVVGDGEQREYWCNRCAHNLIITTTPEQRPKLRPMKAEWSNR